MSRRVCFPGGSVLVRGGGVAAGGLRAAGGGSRARCRRGRTVAVAVVVAVLGPVLAGGAAAAGAGTAVPGGRWGEAEVVRGLAALSKPWFALLESVSCASAGDCSAGGTYTGRGGRSYAFVVSQHNGTWGRAEQVRGAVSVDSVSCASAGNCGAGGTYGGTAFVVSQKHGRWGKAEKVPGLVALSKGGGALLMSVSCGSAGNCAAGGSYISGEGYAAFIASQKNGSWGKAEEVPGIAALDTGHQSQVNSVSCVSAGNCAAAGYYTLAGGAGNTRAFVVSQKNGSWGKAQEVPGIAALDTGRLSQIESVSCASAGNCTAGGNYTQRSFNSWAFVVSQKNGTWGKAREISGLPALSDGFADIHSVSCPSAGNCTAVGHLVNRGRDYQAFTVSQKNGTWGKAELVPGLATLDTAHDSVLWSVSCSSAGNCSAGGSYQHRSNHPDGDTQAFIVTQHNGTWGKAETVPGSAALNTGDNAEIDSVSCAPAGTCSAGGQYATPGKLLAEPYEPFVVSQAR